MISVLQMLARTFDNDFNSNFDDTFNMFTTTSLIITIISVIIGIVVFAVIIFAIAKAVKNANRIKLDGEENVFDKLKNAIDGEKESSFTICEYCGSNNDKTSKTCSGCGATLNHKNNKK